MKQNSDRIQLNNHELKCHLKSAVDVLTPDVFNRIDLSVAQEAPESVTLLHGQDDGVRVAALRRRLWGGVLASAACLCLLFAGGGMYRYHYQNRQIDSIIGIDVNPSVELSINRKNRILSAEALNDDAEMILNEMDLTGVDLNVAVNAVIGSMVTHGYLDDLENTILVTVNNDSIRKATALRTSVVEDIENTLRENQIRAVVYDQQAVEKDETKVLAEQYGISYGKAYFLSELIEQNGELSIDDMGRLSSMTMEQIAGEIAEGSLVLGGFAEKVEEREPSTEAETVIASETAESSVEETAEESSASDNITETEAKVETSSAASGVIDVESSAEENGDEVEPGRVDIDYVDYEDGIIYVYFATYVDWKNPTVSVKDGDGTAYPAMVQEAEKDSCMISVDGLENAGIYTFVLGGLTPKEGGKATTVEGYFEKHEIAGELAGDKDKEDEEGSETSEWEEQDQPQLPSEESRQPQTELETKGETDTQLKAESGEELESGPV